MTSSPHAYPDFKAPREDGEILIWPEPQQLLAETLANQRALSSASGVLVQNVPLPELRRRQRQWIHHDDANPLIADAHQTELHHAGVWVKRVLSHFAAVKIGGSAAHFAVDTDAPKHLHVRWIGASEPVTDDPDLTQAHWTGALDAPSPAHLEHLQRRLNESRFHARPAAHDFLTSLRRLAIEQPKLAPALTNAMHELDWSLNLRHHAMLASPIWHAEPFLVFAHHLIARAGQFAATYNAALADYRRERKVRSATRPMPDLATTSQPAAAEIPFWLDQLDTGDRGRLSALARDGGYLLSAPNGDALSFRPEAQGWEAAAQLGLWLRRNQLRLSPRALTLTMFLRMFVVDQFVHGIGGGQYDQITDRIIAAHFQIAPPRFSVATGTMYLPEAVGRSRVCVPCVAQEGHRLRHALLGERKRELVAQIAAAPRKSAERYATFATMHRELASAAMNHPAIARWEQQLRDAQARETEESAIFDRELFYAMQPRERLVQMIERFAAGFS
jgi:hypothetical protein